MHAPKKIRSKENVSGNLENPQNQNVSEVFKRSSSFHIHVSLTDSYFLRIDLSIFLQPNRRTNPGEYINRSQIQYMNVGIGNEAAQFHSFMSGYT